jgi:pSer/pThr/pTyr-binding forkhead associated (FHA) protein/CheY-like chemotaxis protein
LKLGDGMSQSQLPWVIELIASPIPQPIRAQFEKRLVIGRSDTATKFLPDVDLSPYHAELYGISRQHAALVVNSAQLMVVDLNSGNGTYLNGVKLTPHEENPLRSQDRLQLGKLPLEVKVLIAPSYPVGFYKDVSMQMNHSVVQGAGQTILLVQTDEDVSRVLTGVLEQCGFKVVVAHNVVTAIRLFTQKRPSAVLLDWTLPDMPGVELCRYVRRDTNYHMTPLVVITKEKKPSIVDEALDAGADVVLSEPLSIKEVQHIVTTLVGQQEQGASSFNTRHLVGTAPLQGIQPQTRRNSIVLFVTGSKEPMVLTVTQPITFGRSVSQNFQSHIDLSRNNAADNGVSRLHARLLYENRTFYIEDMNSVNGTYLNGDPLEPGLKTPLRNADEVRFGRLRAYAYFLEDSDKPE